MPDKHLLVVCGKFGRINKIFQINKKGVTMLIKKREIINYVRAIENPPDDIEFESCNDIYDLGVKQTANAGAFRNASY